MRYRRNQLELEPPARAPARERRRIEGLSTLGLVVNPKTMGPVLAMTDGSHVSIRSLFGEGPLALLMRIGNGYYEWDESAEASGYPRVHTPDGARIRGMGYGTSLYTALCLGAHLEFDNDIRLDVGGGSGDGVCSGPGRSSDADRWWHAASRQGLTRSVDFETEEEEEGVDLEVDASDLEGCVPVDGEITYVNRVNVDIRRTADQEVDIYPYESVSSNELVVAEFVTEIRGGQGDDADVRGLWKKLFDDTDLILAHDADALVALDVRGLDEESVKLLAVIYADAQLGDAAIDALWFRWRHELDPDDESPQLRLYPNADSGIDEVALARERVGWDRLGELP